MKYVWQFTNKRKLTKAEFARYFEKKVKSTIRKYNMPIQIIKSNNLKAKIINSIIKNLPQKKGKLTEESLNNISNNILYMVMYGNSKDLKKLFPKNQPLYFLSNKEILLYAKLVGIKGKLEERKEKIRKIGEINNFITKIESRNPDLRHNIVNALLRNPVF